MSFCTVARGRLTSSSFAPEEPPSRSSVSDMFSEECVCSEGAYPRHELGLRLALVVARGSSVCVPFRDLLDARVSCFSVSWAGASVGRSGGPDEGIVRDLCTNAPACLLDRAGRTGVGRRQTREPGRGRGRHLI